MSQSSPSNLSPSDRPQATGSAVELRIAGRVQGVGFRYSTCDRAVELGIRGRVRNEPDGTVHVHAEADPERLRSFIQWCDTGPPSARVESVTATETEPRGYPDFRITYGARDDE